METNTIEQTDQQGNTITYTQAKTGLPPAYLLAAGIGAVGLLLLMNRKRSFLGKFITPLVMAAVYKKVIEVVENAGSAKKDAEMPAAAQPVQPAY